MPKFSFETLMPEGDITWMGFNKDGTLAYGTQIYNERTKVKVYRASIFGGVHEIADIDFVDICEQSAIFYTQRQELVWMHAIRRNKSLCLPVASCVVIFNVENGQLKRYYAERDVTEYLIFMNAYNDVMVLNGWLDDILENADDETCMFELQLNDAHETFSITFLAKFAYDEVDLVTQDWGCIASLCYCRDDIVLHCDSSAHDFNYLWRYCFQGQFWHLVNVHTECQPPNAQETVVPMYDGRDYYCLLKSTDRIRLVTLDAGTLTWKQVFMNPVIPLEPAYLVHAQQWLTTSNGQTGCSFSTKSMTTAESTTTEKSTTPAEATTTILRIDVHRKKMPLKDLCLLALWSHVRCMWPDFQLLTDHEISRRLMLSAVLKVDDYFGREFT